MKYKKIMALTATLALSLCACAGCGHKKAADATTATAQETTDVTLIGTSGTHTAEGETETESVSVASTESASDTESTSGVDQESPVPETDAEESGDATSESGAKDTGTENAWENPFSFQISVNDVVMALPAPAQQMLDAGFTFPTNVEETLEADSTSTFRMESPSGDRIMVTLANPTSKARDLKDCTICFLMADQSSAENTKITLPGDITYGASEQSVRNFIGVEPNDEIIDDGVTHLTYHKNGDPQEFANWMEFQFADGKLIAILMQVNAYGGYQA